MIDSEKLAEDMYRLVFVCRTYHQTLDIGRTRKWWRLKLDRNVSKIMSDYDLTREQVSVLYDYSRYIMLDNTLPITLF